MLKLSKKVEYGLIALVHMEALEGESLASAKEMAEAYHIPGELLGKVLQALARHGLLESVHGAHGGYRLARPLAEITVGNVIEALEGPVHISTCQDDPEACSQFCACNIREPVLRIQSQLQHFIHSIQLSAFGAQPPAQRWQPVEIR